MPCHLLAEIGELSKVPKCRKINNVVKNGVILATQLGMATRKEP